MKTPIVLALVALALGCNTPPHRSPASSTAPPPPPPPPPPGNTVEAPPPGFPPGHEPPEDDRGGGGGRLAFIHCTPESKQVQMCAQNYVPVCGHMDTGVRCVKPPCPSEEPRTFSNACMACMEPKTVGYFPMSCEEINKPTAP